MGLGGARPSRRVVRTLRLLRFGHDRRPQFDKPGVALACREMADRAAVKREFDGLKGLYSDYLAALRNAYPLPSVPEPAGN